VGRSGLPSLNLQRNWVYGSPLSCAGTCGLARLRHGSLREAWLTMKNIARFAILTLPLLVACKKKDPDAGGKAEKTTESKTASPPKDEKPLELTDMVQLEKGVTDPDDKRFVGLKVKAPTGAKVESGLTGVLVRIGERQAYEIGVSLEPGQYVATSKKKANED